MPHNLVEGRKMAKFKKVLLLILMLIMATGIVSIKTNIVSAQETVIFVDPPLIKDLPPSSEFSIDVKIANVSNLWAFDIKLTWDPEILEYVSHETKVPVETYPEGILHEPIQQVKNEVNSDEGYCWVAYSSMSPAKPFNGSGVIFTITFYVKNYGRTALAIAYAKLAGFGLPPPPISFTKQDGFFINVVPPTAKIYVDPPSIVNSTLIPCKNFTIDVKIDDAYYLSEFEFYLVYNTTVLDTSHVQVNPEFPSPTVQIAEEEGRIEVSASTTSITGNLTLASITFHVTSVGESILDLCNVTLLDDLGEPIEFEEPGDGYFNNVFMAKIFVYPPELVDPTLAPGSMFSIDAKMQDAINLYGYKFKLSYDPNIITCLGAFIIPPTNDTNFNPVVQVDNKIGVIQVNVTYYEPAEPIVIREPKTVTTITFQVKNYGSTLLDLYDTKLVDSEGRAIPHIAEDGFFATITADVAVINIEVSSNAVYPGRIVVINVTVANLGDVTATFNVTVYYNTTKLETVEVSNLMPKENVTLTFIWDTTGLESCSTFQIKAEASIVSYEINVENNVLLDGYVKIKLIGDINGDGIVDIYDVAEACLSYGSKRGDPFWSEEADLAPEWGLIDIFDVATLLYFFSQSC